MLQSLDQLLLVAAHVDVVHLAIRSSGLLRVPEVGRVVDVLCVHVVQMEFIEHVLVEYVIESRLVLHTIDPDTVELVGQPQRFSVGLCHRHVCVEILQLVHCEALSAELLGRSVLRPVLARAIRRTVDLYVQVRAHLEGIRVVIAGVMVLLALLLVLCSLCWMS